MSKKQLKPVVSISGLVVRRTKQFSLEVPELHIQAGSIVCIAGANGSGKSTLLEAILGIVTPNQGSVAINGRFASLINANERVDIGFIPDDPDWLVAELTAMEYFNLLANIYKRAGVSHNILYLVKDLANRLQFNQFSAVLGTLSHGNKKKVQIIAALMHKPRVLVVDEIRNGLDPIAIKQVELLLANITREKVSIVAASHDLWWAERIANTILLLHNGKVLLHKPVSTVVKSYGSIENAYMQHCRVGS